MNVKGLGLPGRHSRLKFSLDSTAPVRTDSSLLSSQSWQRWLGVLLLFVTQTCNWSFAHNCMWINKSVKMCLAILAVILFSNTEKLIMNIITKWTYLNGGTTRFYSMFLLGVHPWDVMVQWCVFNVNKRWDTGSVTSDIDDIITL